MRGIIRSSGLPGARDGEYGEGDVLQNVVMGLIRKNRPWLRVATAWGASIAQSQAKVDTLCPEVDAIEWYCGITGNGSHPVCIQRR